MTTLFHNPRCSKSREALHLLKDQGETVQIKKYLENPPSVLELKQILGLLKLKPIELVRTQEDIWKNNYKDRDLSDEEIIKAMAENPKLIERPIAIKNTKAVIGRPPSKVLDIL